MTEKFQTVADLREQRELKPRMSGNALSFLRHQLEKTNTEINFWRNALSDAERSVAKCRGTVADRQDERLDLIRAIELLEKETDGKPLAEQPENV